MVKKPGDFFCKQDGVMPLMSLLSWARIIQAGGGGRLFPQYIHSFRIQGMRGGALPLNSDPSPPNALDNLAIEASIAS